MKKSIKWLAIVALAFFTTQSTVRASSLGTYTFQQQPLKKDGSLDKRYNANKHVKKDGKPDMRYKTSKKAVAATTTKKTTKKKS